MEIVTYSYIRLVYIDGKHHDFIYANASSAKIAFSRYLDAANKDREKYGADASVYTSEKSIQVNVTIRYGLAQVALVSWAATMHTDVGFSN
jgi:hypothetical protein